MDRQCFSPPSLGGSAIVATWAAAAGARVAAVHTASAHRSPGQGPSLGTPLLGGGVRPPEANTTPKRDPGPSSSHRGPQEEVTGRARRATSQAAPTKARAIPAAGGGVGKQDRDSGVVRALRKGTLR